MARGVVRTERSRRLAQWGPAYYTGSMGRVLSERLNRVVVVARICSDALPYNSCTDHCKCLRTLDQARDYFRQYRAKKKDERDGAPARSGKKRSVDDTEDTRSDDLEDDDEEGESSSQGDDDDNNGGPSRQKQPRKAPPPRPAKVKSQPAAAVEDPGNNSVSMMQFQMMMQQQQAMSFPQMMMGGYPMASDFSLMGGMGGMSQEAFNFNSFPFQMWQQQQQQQQQQQMVAMMMMAQQQPAQAVGVGEGSDMAQQQQAMAAAMMMAQQQQMAMMLHLHQQHALNTPSALGQGQIKDEEVKVKEEEKTSPVDEGKEGSEDLAAQVPPPLPPPPANPILGPVVMFPAAYASTVIPPYPTLSTYGFDCNYSSSNVPSLFVKASPQIKKPSMTGAASQASLLSEHLRVGLLDPGYGGNGSHCSSREHLVPRQSDLKGEEDNGGTSDQQPQEERRGFTSRQKRTSSSDTIADENGMPLPHTSPLPLSQPPPQANTLDTITAAKGGPGGGSDGGRDKD